MRASPDLRMGMELTLLSKESYCGSLSGQKLVTPDSWTQVRARCVPESRQFLGPHRCTWCRAHIFHLSLRVGRARWLQALHRWRQGGVLWRWHRHSDSREARRLEFPIRAAQPVPVTRMLHSIPQRPFAQATILLSPELFVSLELDPCPLFGERRQPPPKQRLGLLASIRGVSVLSLRPRVMHKLRHSHPTHFQR